MKHQNIKIFKKGSKHKMKQPASNHFAIHYEKPSAIWQLSEQLLSAIPFDDEKLTFCCIGTDRSTGDSLGPIVGSYLKSSFNFPFKIVGTLEHPLHALNIEQTVTDLQKTNPYLVAIDACLGEEKSVGLIVMNDGPIYPGKAVKKKLPPIGNTAIKGVVNVGGFMEATILQNTRLHVTQTMSSIIAKAILLAWQRYLLNIKHNYDNDRNNENSWQQIGYTNFR